MPSSGAGGGGSPPPCFIKPSKAGQVGNSMARLFKILPLLLYFMISGGVVVSKWLQRYVADVPETRVERHQRDTMQYLRDNSEQIEYLQSHGRWSIGRFSARIQSADTDPKKSST